MRTIEADGTTPSLLRHRPYWRWSAATQFGRLPGTMAPLAFTVLTTATTGSYRAGAMMMVAFVIGELVAAIPVGRLLDRVGPGRGSRLLLVASACAVLGVVTAARADLPTWGLLAATGVCGAVVGGLSAGFRSVLAATVPGDVLLRAISVDAILVEAVVIAGPVLAVALGTFDSTAPLFGMALAFVVSALILPVGRKPATTTSTGQEMGLSRIPWRLTIGWLACLFTVGHLLSALEVGALGLAERVGAQQGFAALLIAVLSVAGIAGSALFVWRGRVTTPVTLLCLASLATGGGLVAAGFGWAGLLAGLVLVGLCTGPLLSLSSVALQRVLPESRRSEGFSVAYVVQSAGFASGAFSLGVLDLGLAIALGAASAIASGVLVLGTGRGG